MASLGMRNSSRDAHGIEETSSTLPVLQFATWQSAVEDGFWEQLARLKLDTLRLSEDPHPITGFYSPASYEQISSHLTLSGLSLGDESGPSCVPTGAPSRCQVEGVLCNTNTIESFRAFQHAALLRNTTEAIWAAIQSGQAEHDPSRLNRFALLSYADLKSWAFYYWFVFPGLVMDPPARASAPVPASEAFANPQEVEEVMKVCQERLRVEFLQPPSQQHSPSAPTAASAGEANPAQFDGGGPSSTPGAGASAFLLHLGPGGTVRGHPLHQWEQLQLLGGQVILVFCDPCHLASNPGWPLRNLLALAAARWHVKKLRVLGWRENRGRPDAARCLVLDVEIPEQPGWSAGTCPKSVGWEQNLRGKSGPRLADLAPSMDPVRLSAAAADLNLKLMRWRVLPSLDIASLSATRCLLLGAGTLGCQVARGLLAWGVRHITLVDCGRVAFSNPLRQSLFELTDCLGGGKPKAPAAAARLKQILPGVHAEGVQMSIPMPGHHVGPAQEEAVREDCARLRHLVQTHDIVFLLTDTRESRWLPTLLCAAYGKMAINGALGFDTFLVMRHGGPPAVQGSASANPPAGEKFARQADTPEAPPTSETSGGHSAAPELAGPRLGCYFCNDVVAPLDSTLNRTLDQQCTVTRPGTAPLCAALAVELAVALLHHPWGVSAPADSAQAVTDSIEMPLGIIPHQIRGFLAHYSQLLVKGEAFDKCTACSLQVVEEFSRRGDDFLLQAFNQPHYLEDLTGLTELMRATDDVALLDWVDDDDEDVDIIDEAP